MPIPKEELHKPENSFLYAPGHATFGQAMAALNATQGDRSCFLVVKKSDNTWATGTFSDILLANANATAGLAGKRLDEVEGLQETEAVEWSDIEMTEALEKASKTGRLILMEGDKVVGVLTAGMRTLENASQFAELNQLAGQFVDLIDFGDVLLPQRAPQTEAEKKEG